MRGPWCLKGTAIVVLFLIGTAMIYATSDEWGRKLYPSQYGAPDGWPGCVPGKMAVMGRESGKPLMQDRFPKWGHPEYENYPGSVEHFRTSYQKYLPPINAFNATSLIKNWKMVDQRVATTDFEEPIYYMPMYGQPVFTGKKRSPVKVYGLKKDGSNAIQINMGKLRRGMYAVRLIGALPDLETDWVALPPRLVIQCTVNDKADGGSSTWIRHHLANSEFYCVGEWFFHAVDNREYTVTIKLDPESATDLMVHNVDLHDALGGCAEKAIRSMPGDLKIDLKGLTAKQRQARDDYLWNSLPPDIDNLNSPTFPLGYFQSPKRAKLSKGELDRIGTWEMSRDGKRQVCWPMINKKLRLRYSLKDYLAAKPLPDPYPYKDRGWGVYLPDKEYLSPIHDATKVLRKATLQQISRSHQWAYQDGESKLVKRYNRTKDPSLGWDAAMLLCRQAYVAPAYITFYKRTARFMRRIHESNRPGLRRQSHGYIATRLKVLAINYDRLFDFIAGNEEFAKAVQRFVPWIDSSEKLCVFLDQRLLALTARELMNYNMTTGSDGPVMAFHVANLMKNPEASRPLMEYLFNRTWAYPMPVASLLDYMVTTETRDGTNMRGSFYYTNWGSEFSKFLDLSHEYMRIGGDQKYDLTDRNRFPKAITGMYFPLEGRVAGKWPLSIGDVGGVIPYELPPWFSNVHSSARSGWKYTRDPVFAALIKHHGDKSNFSAWEWKEIEAAAEGMRDPFMTKRSRVMSAWAGILEDGHEFDDFRLHRAATLRVGVGGHGHSHSDSFDLQIFALGCQMTPDGGQRPGYGSPSCQASMNHNVVEIDNQDWQGKAWIRALSDMEGSRVMNARGIPTLNLKGVNHLERTVALIDVTPGKAGEGKTKDVTLPMGYLLDVYRVAGGKQHVYGFHGCPGEGFRVNAIDPRRVPRYDTKENADDLDAAYLRKYVVDNEQGAGNAPPTVIAQWTLGREPYEFKANREGKLLSYRAKAPEQTMLGRHYDADAPRKHLRLHLLDQKDARLLWGKWVSAPYTHSGKGFGPGKRFTKLHVMKKSDKQRESVFAGIIETYAGDTPVVAKTALLPIAKNEEDARRLVAVKVDTTNGHEDILLSDGRPLRERSISVANKQMAFTGRYGYVSRDKDGIRQASISGGTVLDLPGVIRLAPVRAEYSGTVENLDQVNRRFDLSTEVPEKLIGRSFWEVGNDEHKTSLEVMQVKGKRISFRKGLELVSTRVKSVDLKSNTVVGQMASLLMGLAQDNGPKPGMREGLWVSNETMTKWWQCKFLDGTRSDGYRFKLHGDTLTEGDFPINGTLRVWEMGAGDTAKLETFVNVRREATEKAKYEVHANVAFSISLPLVAGEGVVEVSVDGHTWEGLKAVAKEKMLTVNMNEQVLGSGTVFLRVR